MKKLINIFIAFAVLAIGAVSCQKEELPEVAPTLEIDQKLVGEWQLHRALSDGIQVNQDIDVYLCINADCTFELYQKSGTQSERYEKYTGTCSSENGILSGVYSNGKPWGSKYTFSFTFIVDGMILKSYNLIEVQQYYKVTIPEKVKAEATLVNTKSAVSTGNPIL